MKTEALLRQEMERLLYEVKTVVARHPAPALPAARWRGHGVLLGPDTDILIEGFPRSANSFAVAAFGMAQPGPVGIAHHIHAPAHVIAAVRDRVPAMVLARDPEDAVLEFVIARPYLTPRQALRGFLRFYEPLLPYRGGFVVGDFPQVTTDFGEVVERVNALFGAAFVPFEHTPTNESACFEAMDRFWRGKVDGETLERIVGRPSSVRDAMKARLEAVYRSPELAALRRRAEDLYRVFRGAR
ncbi:MAG TPA: hypothetical protein VJN50_02420 [Actinomycetota bacterium]|nr:hypothetical protein [Actinomycetota bacterium]